MKTKFLILLSACCLLLPLGALAQRTFDTSKLYFATNGGTFTNYYWSADLRAYTNNANHGTLGSNSTAQRWEYRVAGALVATNNFATNAWRGTNGTSVYTSYWAAAGSPTTVPPQISTNQAAAGNTNPAATPAAAVINYAGTNNPEGVFTAGKGSLYSQFDAAAPTNFVQQWIKRTTTGNTGWQIVSSAGVTNHSETLYLDGSLKLTNSGTTTTIGSGSTGLQIAVLNGLQLATFRLNTNGDLTLPSGGTFDGNHSGNGSGLTNIPYSALTGTPASSGPLSTVGTAYALTNNLSQPAINNLSIMEREAVRRGVWNNLADALVLGPEYYNFNPSNGVSYFGRPFTHNGVTCPFGLDFNGAQGLKLPVNVTSNYCLVYVMRFTNAWDWDRYLANADKAFVASIEDTNTKSGNYWLADHNYFWNMVGRSNTNWLFGSTNFQAGSTNIARDIRFNGADNTIPANGEPLVITEYYDGNGHYRKWKNTLPMYYASAGSSNYLAWRPGDFPTVPMNLLTFGSNVDYCLNLSPSFGYPQSGPPNFNLTTNYDANGRVEVPTGAIFNLYTNSFYDVVGGLNDYSFGASSGTGFTHALTNLPGSYFSQTIRQIKIPVGATSILFTGAPNSSFGVKARYYNAANINGNIGGKYQLAAVFVFTNIDRNFSYTNGQHYANAGYAMYHSLSFSDTFVEWVGSSIMRPNANSVGNWAAGASSSFNMANPIYYYYLPTSDFAWVDNSAAGSYIEGATVANLKNGLTSFPLTPLTELPPGKFRKILRGDYLRNTPVNYNPTNQTYWSNTLVTFTTPYITNGVEIQNINTHMTYETNSIQYNTNWYYKRFILDTMPQIQQWYDEASQVSSNMLLIPGYSKDAIHFNGTNAHLPNMWFGQGMRTGKPWPAVAVGSVSQSAVTGWTNWDGITYTMNLTVGGDIVAYSSSGTALFAGQAAPLALVLKPGQWFTGTNISFTAVQQ